MQGVLTANSQVTKFANRAAQAGTIQPGQVILANVTKITATQFLVPDEIELVLCKADFEFLARVGRHRIIFGS